MYQFDQMIQASRAVPETASPLLAGNSLSAQSLRQLLSLAAGSADPVLITGPSGAGKHTLAKVIHAHSPRANAPFIKTSGSSLTADHLKARWGGDVLYRRDTRNARSFAAPTIDMAEWRTGAGCETDSQFGWGR